MAKILYKLITEKLVTPILIFLLFLALFVGLWPFSFNAENNVKWLADRNGIALSPVVKGWRSNYAGIIYTPDRIDLNGHSSSAIPEITIELWLSAKSTFTHGLGAILTLDDGKDPAAVYFGQWKSSLIIRIRDASDADSYKEIGLRDVLAKNRKSFVTLTSSAAGIELYLNGEWQRSYPNIALFDSRSDAVQLIAGVTVSGKSRWRGEIYGLAMYADTLSAGQVAENLVFWQEGDYDQLHAANQMLALYSFGERQGETIHNRAAGQGDWRVPPHFQIMRKTFLGSKNGDLKVSRSLLKDVIINIAGFLLLGFFMALFLKRRIKSRFFVVVYVFFICSLLSLGIEYLQVWLPQRDSSLLDFVLNSGGGLVGGLGIFVVEWVNGTESHAEAQSRREKIY